MRKAWLYDPALDLVAVADADRDGRFAACCIAWFDPATGVCEIEPLGVAPKHRRRGLAVALCLEVANLVADAGAGRDRRVPGGYGPVVARRAWGASSNGVSREMADRLIHVRWIGGGTGAGKSTIARRLAAAHSLRLHEIEPFSKYVERSNPEDHPLLHRFIGMSMDERWLLRAPEEMLSTFHGYQDELFGLMVTDILALGTDQPVLVEGFSLLPRLVAPLLDDRQRAVWLLPDPQFRRSAFEQRGSLWSIAGQTGDPPRALENLLRRDELFTDRIAREAQSLDLPRIHVRRGMTEDELTHAVAKELSLNEE